MKTVVRAIDPQTPDQATVAEAAELLRTGELVAFPTETVYGLGANALDPAAVRKIFSAKDRPADNPLIVHIAEPADADTYARDIPDVARVIMRHFWPGPLSLVLYKRDPVPAATTAGLDTVVLRCPSHAVARALIREASVPIAAPSANRSGRVSPTRAEHVLADLAGRLPLILDGGAVEYGLESTVLDCTSSPPQILRHGSITEEVLAAVTDLEQIATSSASATTPRSPGTRYRHYAPATPLVLGRDHEALVAWLLRQPHRRRIGVIHHSPLSAAADYSIELPDEPSEAAPRLNAALRELDQEGLDAIVVEGYEDVGIGRALMDRLRRGASEIR